MQATAGTCSAGEVGRRLAVMTRPALIGNVWDALRMTSEQAIVEPDRRWSAHPIGSAITAATLFREETFGRPNAVGLPETTRPGQ